MNKLVIATILASSVLVSANSFADELYIGVSQQGDTHIVVPRNGLTKEQVLSQYGEPVERIAAVGQPPISQWVYANFTVYFEYNIVLHSVKKRVQP